MKKTPAKLSPEIALERLRDLCSRMEKSPAEIENKLKGWGLAEHAESVLSKLQEERFLDSARFASAFARDKVKFNKWGKVKIRYQLRQHRIDEAILETALGSIDPDEYFSMIEEELDKKNKSLTVKNPFQRKAKLYAFGNQRGYESEYLNHYFESRGL